MQQKTSKPFFNFGLNSQIAFWTLLLITVTFFSSSIIGFPKALARALLLFLCHAFIFYAFYAFIVPKYFEKKKYRETIWLALLVFVIVTPLRLLVEQRFAAIFPGQQLMRLTPLSATGFILFSEIAVAAFSSLLRLAVSSFEAKRKMVEIQQVHLEAELRFLKSQLNPHFLFNTINNLYALVLEKSGKAPAALLKLSELLRYFLYECDHDKVSLEKEWKALLSYTELFQLRYEQRLNIQLDNTIKEKMMVEPMILIPLLENSFKHSGIGIKQDAFISFVLAAENGFLTASFHNSKQTISGNEKEEDGGIGLSAIGKRLAIKYPDNHQLAIHEDENNFYVNLSIPFA